jgi:sugar/nucleoside kinase (ribokinase family)
VKKNNQSSTFIKHLLFGDLAQEWIIPPIGKLILGKLGGHLSYTLAGLQIWDSDVGLLSKISRNFPEELLDWLDQPGVNSSGIVRSNHPTEYRRFFAYRDDDQPLIESPMSVFSKLGLSFPRDLLGFSLPQETEDSRITLPENSFRDFEIPPLFFEASTLHVCPLEYLNHMTIPTILRKGNISTVSLDASTSYMHPSFLTDLRILLKGVTAFLTSERKLRSLFFGKTNDLWEMADELSSFGVEMIVIKRGSQGQLLQISPTKTHWQVPAYPARLVDPTGCGDCFSGGFLAGYRKTYDPLQSILYGNVSASFCLECSTPRQVSDFLPGLPELRLNRLKDWVNKI